MTKGNVEIELHGGDISIANHGGFLFKKPMQQKVELGNAVLKGVSRSFYISIRLLPKLMREPVSVGYLLARASDTIADTDGVPLVLKKSGLQKFYAALSNSSERFELTTMLHSDFLSYQSNAKERLLLERLGDVFGWYDALSLEIRQAIDAVLRPIIDGQLWDLEYFGQSESELEQVQTMAELDTYCYQVAGSVGEFWGVVGTLAYSGGSRNRYSKLDFKEMQRLGVNYGKGLQLVNILRDIPEDLEKGRCYLPQADADVSDRESLVRASANYRELARTYLQDGLTYASNLKQKRTKIATVLPALIGLETLDLMDHSSWSELKSGVKITRKEVKKCLWRALFF